MNTNPGFNPEEMKRKARSNAGKLPVRWILVIAALVVVVALLAAYPPFVTVPTGHTGIVVTFGRVADYTLEEGFHLKNPVEQIILMNNRTQKQTITGQAFSSDIQQVDFVCSVNFAILREQTPTLYKTVGVNYYPTVMEPRLLENIKAVFTRYSAEKLMQVRDTLSAQITDLLRPEMEAYGIRIISLAIEDVDFTDAFTEAVEQKQVAEQTKLRVETEQSQQVSVEKATAERQIIAANADAQKRAILAEADASVRKIDADAQAYAREVQAKAEAEANTLIAQSVTEELIKYLQATNWNGQLPQVSGANSILPVIDITNATANATANAGD